MVKFIKTAEEEVIKKLSMELWMQILPGLEAKRNKRLWRITANAADFTDFILQILPCSSSD